MVLDWVSEKIQAMLKNVINFKHVLYIFVKYENEKREREKMQNDRKSWALW